MTTETLKHWAAVSAYWKARGLKTRPAHALAVSGIETVEALAAAGPDRIRGLPNVGRKSQAEIAAVAGWGVAQQRPRNLHAEVAALRLALGLNPAQA
jgi:DNA-directed RNA polymerase alpha subunit